MNSTEKKEWENLIGKYLSNTISKIELDRLLELTDLNNDEDFNDTMSGLWETFRTHQSDTGGYDTSTKFNSLMKEANSLTEQKQRIKKKKDYRWLIAATILGVLLSATIYNLYFTQKTAEIPNNPITAASKDFAPGKSGAILKLANGQEIVLDSAGNGVLAIQGGASVVNEDGQIKYNNAGTTGGEVLYNAVSTPRGRQFKITLADGTNVWLNAASSIEYPAVFSEKERRVSINGEAYFEVATVYNKQNSKVPFIVEITSEGKKAAVNVLGTHFNINAYDNEKEIKTTLIEGAVEFSGNGQQSGRMSAGQQAKLDKKEGAITLQNNVNIQETMAWKNGLFSFNNTDMGTLFRQIERWYDVQMEYQGALPDRRFGGEISRDNNLSQILTILEESNMKFKIDGKKIIVLR